MFCKNCGTKLDDDALFCESCGTQIRRAASAVTQTATEPVEQPASEEVEPTPCAEADAASELSEPSRESQPAADSAEQSAPSMIKRKPWLWIAGAAVLLVVIVFAVFLLTRCRHEWTAATCDAPKTCTLCGKTDGAPLEHQWSAASLSRPSTCNLCGETRGLSGAAEKLVGAWSAKYFYSDGNVASADAAEVTAEFDETGASSITIDGDTTNFQWEYFGRKDNMLLYQMTLGSDVISAGMTNNTNDPFYGMLMINLGDDFAVFLERAD